MTYLQKHPRLLKFVWSSIFEVSRFLGYIKLPIETYLRWLPPKPQYDIARAGYWSTRIKKMGECVRISTGAYIGPCPEKVEIDSYSEVDFNVRIEVFRDPQSCVKIGKYVHIAPHAVIQGHNKVEIGDHVGIAAGSKIYSGSCVYKDPKSERFLKSMCVLSPKEEICIFSSPVKIGDYAFIGLNSVVLPGVKIGRGAVVGAGSVVQRDIPAFTIAVGIPARAVRKRPEF